MSNPIMRMRRVAIGVLAFGALGVSAAQLAGHAAGQDRQIPERTVAMPDCITNWAPICDRWDVPAPNPTHAETAADGADRGPTNTGGQVRFGGTVDMFDCLHHWAPICGTRR